MPQGSAPECCGARCGGCTESKLSSPLSVQIVLTKWTTEPMQALYGSGVAFDLRGTVGVSDSKLRIQLSHTPDPQAPLAAGVKDLNLQPPFQKLHTAVRSAPTVCSCWTCMLSRKGRHSECQLPIFGTGLLTQAEDSHAYPALISIYNRQHMLYKRDLWGGRGRSA